MLKIDLQLRSAVGKLRNPLRQIRSAAFGGYAGTREYGPGKYLVVEDDLLFEVQAGQAGFVGIHGACYGKRIVFLQRSQEIDLIAGEDHVYAGVGLFFEVEAHYFADEVVAAPFHVKRVI